MATKDVNIAITASDKTSAAFNSVQSSLGKLNTSVSTVIGSVGKLTGVFAAIGATAFIKHTIDVADGLAKISQKTTVAVDTLSALANSANLAGVSNEQLGSALVKLNKNIAEAISGTREQVDAFAGLGISVKDANGNIKPTIQILDEIATKFSETRDGAIKTQYAMALFGKAGADLVPFLNQGTEGMRQFGASIGVEFAKQSEAFNDNIDRMGQGLQRFISNAGTPILEWTNAFFSIMRGESAFSAVDELRIKISQLQKEIEKGAESSKMMGNRHLLTMDLNAKIEQLALLKKELASLNQEQAKGANAQNADKPELVAMPNQEIVKALESANDEIKKLINGETEMKVLQFSRLGASESQVAEYRKLLEQAQKLSSLDRQLEEDGKTADELQKKRLDKEKEVKKQYEDSLSPVSKMATKMENIRKLRADSLITADQEFEMLNALYDKTEEFNQTIKTEGFGAAMERGMEAYYKSIKDISGLMEDSVVRAFQGMEDALVNFVKTGKLDFTDLANSIINDLIRIQVRQSIVAPLSQAMSSGGISSLFGMSGSQPPAPVIDASSAVPAFAGGGYTGSGSRSGGIDGMGGFPAILHPNETVVDHSIGQSGGVVVNQTINVTTGVQQTVRAEVMNMLPQIANAAKAAVVDAKMRGGSFASALR